MSVFSERVSPCRARARLLAGLRLAAGLVMLFLALVPLSGQVRPPRDTIIAIVLRTWGFEPPSLTVKNGRVQLVVYNRTGFREAVLRLERQNGPRLREIPMSRLKTTKRETIDLPVGQFVLTEAGHPKWTCRITVVP